MEFKDYEYLIKILNEKKQTATKEEIIKINQEIKVVSKLASKKMSAFDRVSIARNLERPKTSQYIEKLFDSFIELHGDRLFKDDQAIIGGIGLFHNKPVTVIGLNKGTTTQENIERNFGMAHPEGYRKAIRLAKQAEKFKRPIITFVDTAGAFPGKGAEERGQAEAIAKCLFEFSNLKTIVICVVIGEGGSGGALALSVGDSIIMLENAVYSILSPEGFATILWKDGSRFKEASELMKLTSYDLYDKKIVDEIIKEPFGGVQYDFNQVIEDLDTSILEKINELSKLKIDRLLELRYKKYRNIGVEL